MAQPSHSPPPPTHARLRLLAASSLTHQSSLTHTTHSHARSRCPARTKRHGSLSLTARTRHHRSRDLAHYKAATYCCRRRGRRVVRCWGSLTLTVGHTDTHTMQHLRLLSVAVVCCHKVAVGGGRWLVTGGWACSAACYVYPCVVHDEVFCFIVIVHTPHNIIPSKAGPHTLRMEG